MIEKSADLARDKVRMATMHRVKGLKFPFVILAGVTENSAATLTDEAQFDDLAQVDHDSRERSLLFVAATRARDKLLVTGVRGAKSIPKMKRYRFKCWQCERPGPSARLRAPKLPLGASTEAGLCRKSKTSDPYHEESV
jgi:superfamily I DNA/RNA helicase